MHEEVHADDDNCVRFSAFFYALAYASGEQLLIAHELFSQKVFQSDDAISFHEKRLHVEASSSRYEVLDQYYYL